MKKMNAFTNLVATAAVTVVSIATCVAQNNLGQECGCPSVSSRTTSVNMSTLTNGGSGVNAPELSADAHLTCDKIWVLDEKIYVPNGKTLTIDPGTVIKGAATIGAPENATALVIERGGKIMADGTKDCPIVFTAAADPMDGSYSLTNVGKWGGLVILGTATNNLLLATSSQTLGSGHICVGHDGVGYIEGFDASNGLNLFGAGDAAFPTFNDNDNSGIVRYVSVRHAGAILQIGNELNGISLGSVGRGTTFEHVEVVAAADDNIEYFGGTVNVKYISTLFGDDDMFDFDLGYSGKAQFYFGISSDSLNSGNVHTTDNGFECDADDNKDATATSNHSHPIIYNCTMISNGHQIPSADNTGPAAIQAKELTGGEFYNNVFVNWRSGLHLSMSRSTSQYKGDAYDQWVNNSSRTTYLTTQGGVAQFQALKVKNNTFVACGPKNTFGNTRHYAISKGTMVSGKNPALYKGFTPADAADTTQFFSTDGNVAVESVPGIDYKLAFSSDNTTLTDPFHATPLVNLPTSITPPADGFFSVVNYRGAFDANKNSWLSDWALVQVNKITNDNPTDINGDGTTDIDDYSIFISRFNQQDN